MNNIQSYNEFNILEYVTINQGANLATNSTPQQVTFDSGDGPSAGEVNIKTNKTVKYIKKFRGVKREKDTNTKNKAKKQKINKMGINLVSSDQNLSGVNKSVNGGGADYTLQGF
jgi:hypothetical protein